MSDKDSGGEVTHNETIDLNANVNAKLRNPLAGVPYDRLMKDVEIFAEEKNLTDKVDMLKKGALVAQHHDNWQHIKELSDEDKANLKYEKEHKWSHPKLLYITVFLCSIGAATQGWDQTGSNGANLSFPNEFGIPETTKLADGTTVQNENNQWLVGLVNSAPYLGSAGLGCWLSDPLNNYFGRRGTIFITALVLIITPICSGLTHTWQELFVVRLILGLGMGAKGSTVPVFAAENSPAEIRGALVMGWQLWTAFGLFLGYAANCVVINTGNIAWRLQIGSAFIPAVPLAIGIFFCPESPRWLMKKNRYPQAYRSLVRLRHHELQAARDLYYVHVQLMAEKQIIRPTNYFGRLAELFTIPRVRRATLASGIIMLAQQMCGINIIAFYSATVFVLGGSTNQQALYASVGFGAVNFVFAFPALITIDTFGRRSLVLFTFPQMAWSLLAAGLCFLIGDPNVPNMTRTALVALFIYIFAAFYSPGEGPVPFTYSAEVFPLAQREQGMAWAVTICLGFAALLSITFPRIVGVMTITGAFGFYAGLNLVAFVLIFLFLPETKQLTLEELDQVFSVPTRVFMKYQLTQTLPWFIKRWVFFNKNAHIEPLYHLENEDDSPSSREDIVKRAEKEDSLKAEKSAV